MYSDLLQVIGYANQKHYFVFLSVYIHNLFLETYLPSALASFLTAIRQDQNKSTILFYLGIFLGVYLFQALLTSVV